MSKLYIVRGLPGSGKTTWALKQMKPSQSVVLEADDFHVTPAGEGRGEYNWIAKHMEYAHMWCLSNAAYRLRHGLNVYVANTFTQWFEIERYLKMAKAIKCDVEIIECLGNFENVHSVPEKTLDKMRQRYITNEKIKSRIRQINKTTPEEGFPFMEISFKQYRPVEDELVNEGTIYEESL
jgi:predicted kinase